MSIIEALISSVLAGAKRDKDQVKQRTAVVTTVVIAALAGLSPIAKRRQRGAGGTDGLAEKALELAWSVLEDNEADPVLGRAAAEILAAAACIGSDAFAIKLVCSLCEEVRKSIESGKGKGRRCGWVMQFYTHG